MQNNRGKGRRLKRVRRVSWKRNKFQNNPKEWKRENKIGINKKLKRVKRELKKENDINQLCIVIFIDNL